MHDLAPQLAGFPIAVVGGGVAKPQKNRQRQANQGEGNGSERDLEREQVAMQQGDNRRQQDVEQQGEADTLQHRASQHQKQPPAKVIVSSRRSLISLVVVSVFIFT